MESLLKKVKDMDPEERKKLQKLLNDDKKDEKNMDWMYKGERPEREEYLLGRRIDKHIEEEDKVEEDKDAPGASFQDVIARRADLDMHAKMREDPLYAIKQREEETRRKLLQNPIKMKQLEKLMREREKKLKKNKKKKKKKHKRSADSDDSDDDIVNKYLAILKQKKVKSHAKDRDGDRSRHRSDSGDERVVDDRDRLSSHQDDKRCPQRHRDDSQSDDHRPPRRRHGSDDEQIKSYGLLIRGEGRSKTNRSRSRERSQERSHKSSKHHRSRSRDRSRSPHRTKSLRDSHKHSRKSPSRKEAKKRLSSDEMARRRAEMMENAKHRDEQREQNVKQYREEEKREKQELDQQGSSADFLNPMLMKHADKSSLEDRIKRNMYHVQRTRADLDKNFAKR